MKITSTESLKSYIRDVPDFPKKGILFKDISPLLRNADAFRFAVDELAQHFSGRKIDCVAAVEARGFMLGAAVAYQMQVGLVPLRKPGKLPWKTEQETYRLEYGSSALEMHQDGIESGHRVLLIDDLLATGGTVEAAIRLVEKRGGRVEGIGFLIELAFLRGRERLRGYEVFSLIQF